MKERSIVAIDADGASDEGLNVRRDFVKDDESSAVNVAVFELDDVAELDRLAASGVNVIVGDNTLRDNDKER